MDTQKTGHVLLDILLLSFGVTSGLVSESIPIDDLEYYNLALAVILKAVSILSFIIVLLLNASKLADKIKGWFKTKK